MMGVLLLKVIASIINRIRYSISLLLLHSMINYRKTTIATIDALITKVNSLPANPEPTRLTKLAHFLNINLELLKNDIILILNQNFYLRCKLEQASLSLQRQSKKLKESASHMQLSMEMLKQKYQKQIENIKFNCFYHNYRSDHNHLPKSMLEQFKTLLLHKDIQSYKKQQNQEQNQIVSTIKKQREIREFKGNYQGKEHIQRQSKDKGNHRQNISPDNVDKFDLQLRGLQSEEQTILTNHRIAEQLIHSEDSSARKKKNRVVKKQENSSQNHRKKKSDELAELVARQFKVVPIKEQYFSTELL